MNISVSLCPESLAKLPQHGRSAFIRRAILAYQGGGSVSPPPPLKSEEKPAFVRDGRRYLPKWSGNDMETINGQKRHSGPCTEAPHIKAWQGGAWFAYVEAWKWPDPFPGLVEWHAMGCPEKPLEVHRLPLELRGGAVPAASDEPEAAPPVSLAPVVEAVQAAIDEPEAQAVPSPIVHLATGVLCATLPDDI